MYGCRGGGCGSSGYSRPRPLYRINHVSPDRPEPLYAKAHDIRDMYHRMNRVDTDKSGGFYRPGPNPSIGYTRGTSNSGSLGSMDYGAIAKAAQMHDFSRNYN